MPTLDGVDVAALGLQQRNFSDGQNSAPAVIPVIFEQKTVSGGSPAEEVEEPDKPEDAPPTAPEAEEMEPVEDVPPGSELANVESFLEELAKDEESEMLADVPGEPVEEDDGFRKLTDLMPDEELIEPKEEEKKEEEEMPEKEEPKPEQVPQPESNPDAPFQMSNLEGKQKGSINNRGEAAVDAAETPYGKYMRVVKEIVGRDWQRAIAIQSDYSTTGYMKVEFYIRADGTTEGVRTTELQNNRVLQSITLDVILKAKFPPPSEDVLSLRADRRVHIPFGFHVR